MILTYFLCYEESLEFSYYSCWQHTGAMKITKTHSFLFLLDLFLDLVRWDQLVQLLAATGTTSFEISFEMAVGGWAAPVRPGLSTAPMLPRHGVRANVPHCPRPPLRPLAACLLANCQCCHDFRARQPRRPPEPASTF